MFQRVSGLQPIEPLAGLDARARLLPESQRALRVQSCRKSARPGGRGVRHSQQSTPIKIPAALALGAPRADGYRLPVSDRILPCADQRVCRRYCEGSLSGNGWQVLQIRRGVELDATTCEPPVLWSRSSRHMRWDESRELQTVFVVYRRDTPHRTVPAGVHSGWSRWSDYCEEYFHGAPASTRVQNRAAGHTCGRRTPHAACGQG